MSETRVTESVQPGLQGFDAWPDGRILEALMAGQSRALAAVEAAEPELRKAAELITSALRAGGRLIFAGAGASARIAVQEGAELAGTFGLDEARIVYLIAGGRNAVFETLSEEEDNADAGRRDASSCRANDVLVAVAASGSTPYTCAAAETAKARGAQVIAVVNNSNSQLGRLANVEVTLDSGPEVIPGSTRLGAGTAQKIALNLMFVLALTRAGGVHDGLMVDLVAGNAKLRERARSIVMTLSSADQDRAAAALAAAAWRIKPAVLILKGAADLAAAQALLTATDGNLRRALARLEGS